MVSRQQRLRALAGMTRLQLLDRLRDAAQPMSVRDLAGAMGLHENSVREQLGRLLAVELVTRIPSAPTGRGRPPMQYAARTPAPEEQEASAFHQLALVLADQVARQPNAEEAAAEAGERWGRAVAQEMPEARDEASAMQLIMSLLERAGFSPEAPRGPTEPIRLHRCPFGELAIERAGVICGLHLGMLRGVLREIEAPLSATRLEPFAGPGVCYAFVEPRTVR